MIKNGFYYPKEMYNTLYHENENGEIEGKAIIGISAGNRTAGKTVGHAIRMIEEFERTDGNSAFALLARTQQQMQDGYATKWWTEKVAGINDSDGIIQRFVKRHKFKYSAECIEVDGKPFIYCPPISMSRKVKDEWGFKNCKHMIMDEAVQEGERSLIYYQKSALKHIFTIWETAARGWNGYEGVDGLKKAKKLLSIIFIMNTSERDNWVFNDLGVNNFLRADTKFTAQKQICVEVVNNKNVAMNAKDDPMAEVMLNSVSGREYFEMSQNNAFIDNTAFVKPMGLDFKCLKIQLCVRTHCLGVFETESGFHVAKINPDNRSRKICNRIDIHTEDVSYEFPSDWQTNLWMLYMRGKVTFQTQEAKGLFLEYMA